MTSSEARRLRNARYYEKVKHLRSIASTVRNKYPIEQNVIEMNCNDSVPPSYSRHVDIEVTYFV